MIIENSTFNNNGGDSTKANLMQFGEEDTALVNNNVIIRNSNIINRPELGGNTAPEGLVIFNGSGFLIDSSIFNIDNTGQDPELDLSAIHPIGTSNMIIRNSIFQGPATNALYPDENSSNIVIENNLVSEALKNGIFLAATTASTVVGNTVVNNGTNGIFIGEASSSNAIVNNIVNNNGFTPISSSAAPIGNGIAIASDSSKNIIEGNAVFNNAVNGIDNEGTNNKIFGNEAFGNGNKNYFPTTGIVISNAGSATLAGANISSM